LRGFVSDLHLRPQNILRQSRGHDGGKLAGEHSDNVICTPLHQAQQCDHAPLRVVIPGQLRLPGPELGNVVRQLSLQEFHRIHAAHAHDARVVEANSFQCGVHQWLQRCFSFSFIRVKNGPSGEILAELSGYAECLRSRS
jgi:hypothetical protein